MKRFICTLILTVILITMLSVPASASVYTETFVKSLTYSFEERINDGNGLVLFANYAWWDAGSPTAYTGEYVPTDEPGRVFVYIAKSLDGNGVAYSASGHEIVENTRSCIVNIPGGNFATKTIHTAVRTVNGVATVWNYTYIDPYHVEEPEEEMEWEELVGSVS